MRLENSVISRADLKSHFIRNFVGDREFKDVSTLEIATGVDLGNLTRWKWVNWIIGKALGIFSWSVTSVFQYLYRQGIKAVSFDMTQLYEEIDQEIKSNGDAIASELGSLVGSGLVWLGSMVIAGQATFKFPVVAARVGLALAEEGGQELSNRLGSFLENTLERLIDNILMSSWAGCRPIQQKSFGVVIQNHLVQLLKMATVLLLALFAHLIKRRSMQPPPKVTP